MAQQLPIRFSEVLQLASLGVQPSFGFANVTLQSEKYVCIRDNSNGANQVVIVDLESPENVVRRPISADSVIMHPKKMIIALKAQRQLQVFDLEAKAKLNSYVMNQDVVYWTWISDSTIGIVTETSVYHWSLSGSDPVKMFDRHSSLNGTQIISYRSNYNEEWFTLVGISSRDNRIAGNLQLYSKKRKVSQPLESHASAFAVIQPEGLNHDVQVLALASRLPTGSKLSVVEIDRNPNNPAFATKTVDLFFPPEAINDFPIAIQIAPAYGVAYVATKFGFIHVYDLETAKCIYMNRVSGESIFVTTPHGSVNGVMAVNRKGQVLSVSINPDTIIPYVLNNLNDAGLAVRLASRANLPGADNLYAQQFQQLMMQGNYGDAAKVAASSPRGILRTAQVIEQFKQLPAIPGQIAPILQYFGTLLDKGPLNEHESLELARPVLAQNRVQLLEKWFNEDKLACTEALGDLIKPVNSALALKVYETANIPNKVVMCLSELGDFNRLVSYTSQTSFTPDYVSLLQNLVRVNPDQAADFATQIYNSDPSVNLEKIVDIFMSQNLVQQATAFLLDALKDDNPAHSHLQTRLLEMNLINAPQVADAILGNQMFSHFDHQAIASLCERAGLVQRALELYEKPADIKRVIVHTNLLNPEWLMTYFGKFSPDEVYDYLREMLRSNLRQNLQAVVQIATRYSDLVGSQRLIEMFEKFRTFEGLYYYLGSIVNITQDADVVYKYIQAACLMNQFTEVERICRDNNVYNPEKVKNLLKEAKLADQLPLILVCDRYNFVNDLIFYLYRNNLHQFIQIYVQRINPLKTPHVVGALLDMDCEEEFVKNLLNSVIGQIPIDELVEEVEKRNRLKLLLPYLESLLQSGNQDRAIYDALAKIYIDSNNNPEVFLKENDIYDTLSIGKYCEKRDPYLAFIAYEKGTNDTELITLCNENSMFKQLARYLLKRSEPELWLEVLQDQMFRRPLLDQVIATAVPESSDPEAVSIVVRSLMEVDLPGQLIELLEKIVLQPSSFSENANLQNLLFLTAIKADKSRVMEYIDRLSNYDVEEISEIAVENGLFEEAFKIYKIHHKHEEAMKVLVEDIVSLDRAEEYAEIVDQPEVWSRLAKAQLGGIRISEAIASYLKANDPSNYEEVIELSSRAGKYEDLIKYLFMARTKMHEPDVDSAILVAYARTNQLTEMETFLIGSNVADVKSVGDECFDSGNYEAAKIMYSSISNWSMLASTLVYLKEYQGAVDCARKANSIKVWKQVGTACIEQREFRLAQICGLNLIVHAEELTFLIRLYEERGYFDEVISLMEAGLGLERAHMAFYTELAILYSKYKPERLMEHLKLFWGRLNMAKVVKACDQAHLWNEAVFLYVHDQSYDNAAAIMMEEPEAFDHQSFKDIIVHVANLELYYRALHFYLEQHPMLLTDLLAALTPRIDHSRVIRIFEKSENTPLIMNFMVAIQHLNIEAVNNAYNDLLIEMEDYQSLQDSIENYDRFDAIALAKRLEKHTLLEFRRIAAYIYRKNRRWIQSIELSKQDRFYKDAIITARDSNQTEIAEDLMKYFVEIGNYECFTAILYTCYHLLRNDLVMEISWRKGLQDYAYPYFINFQAEMFSKILTLEKDIKEKGVKSDEEPSTLGTGIFGNTLMLTQGPMATGSNNTGASGFGF
ncbi:clathrin heavy chain Chc1 [Schizosaccharomyces cryophilus OY26]|uniref:Clathrin heavy chain n=1 Tax=Schizosaccharomyces cryophilus (strain OY26 / ATCC MYA-4695 / CBS 11777 / NBRC 106824 / NRRL Y48691) TaxID=653667 RepID=S9W1Z7_SCHCR|nr:clathrin heavy chain Chc1 [Schizosaccharomyces cryophilus OY26]EPY52055.1 clathrin heavy chain Chc1 [Schizosaccharomyces cryophilus OY26]